MPKKTTKARPARVSAAKSARKASAKARPAPKPKGKPIAAKAPVKAGAKVHAKVQPKALAKGPAKHNAKGSASKPEPTRAPIVSKSGRKGITIVQPKLVKKPEKKAKITSVAPASVGRLLDPKNPHARKPLIPSGPKAAGGRPLGAHGHEAVEQPKAPVKSPLQKKDLERFRAILVKKRAQLVGDVSQMENEALQGQSGSLSNLPQHMAEQGSDTYDQSLALDLAAADRKMIKEIDDAIKRIDQGTYGVCELSGKPIKMERLEELPWARYTIEAARELERRSMWT